MVPNKIRKLGDSVHGSDMTACTDRFPIEIQHEIIAVRFGKKIANHWKHVMQRNFPFEGRSVRYNCGTPMGVLSS